MRVSWGRSPWHTARGSNYPKGSRYQGSQRPQPHLEDGSTYRASRPTQLDKIKNFRDQVQPGVVVEAPLLPRPQGLELPEELAATVTVSDEVGLAERLASSFRCVSGSSTATAANRASRVRRLVDALWS